MERLARIDNPTSTRPAAASYRVPTYVALLTLSIATSCSPTPPPALPTTVHEEALVTTNADRLEPFARLYGYLRFFHPSDAAAEAAWDELAITGAREVLLAADRRALREALVLFAEPIAPTARVYAEGEPPPSIDLGDENAMVAWQHRGIGLSAQHKVYDSERTSWTQEHSKDPRLRAKIVSIKGQLFDAMPEKGEILDLPLGEGLRLRLPVVLPDSLASQQSEPTKLDPTHVPTNADDPAVRAAAVIIAWNVLHHFYPYFDVIDEDWDAVLGESIDDALEGRGSEDLHLTLERMVAKLQDGHGRVSGPTSRAVAPVSFARIEGKVIVVNSEEDSGLAPGDELVAVDGVPIADALAEVTTRISGSPQWIETRTLRWAQVTAGAEGESISLGLKRGDDPITVNLTRKTQPPTWDQARRSIEVLDDGVFYIDLDRATWTQIKAQLDEIAAAPGVVFDLRGYPNSNHKVLSHLLDEKDEADWMFVPQILYPDQQRIAGWESHGWEMTPAKPHISGRVAFVTDGRAISYAESVMGMVEGYGLGEIVGAPTAGTNGNVNSFDLPGGFNIMFTGMKVTRINGRQHHMIGVEPSIPSEPTIAGIMAGRDEVLEAALAAVRAPE